MKREEIEDKVKKMIEYFSLLFFFFFLHYFKFILNFFFSYNGMRKIYLLSELCYQIVKLMFLIWFFRILLIIQVVWITGASRGIGMICVFKYFTVNLICSSLWNILLIKGGGILFVSNWNYQIHFIFLLLPIVYLFFWKKKSSGGLIFRITWV